MSTSSRFGSDMIETFLFTAHRNRMETLRLARIVGHNARLNTPKGNAPELLRRARKACHEATAMALEWIEREAARRAKPKAG